MKRNDGEHDRPRTRNSSRMGESVAGTSRKTSPTHGWITGAANKASRGRLDEVSRRYLDCRVDESCDDYVLEPLPALAGVPMRPASVADSWRPGDRSTANEFRPRPDARRGLSATFTSMIALHPALLADLPNWWRRRADRERVRVSRALLLEAPSFEPSGTWRLRGSLRSPWSRRWIPVELQLWPLLGAWTKVSLEPQRAVRPGRRYFRNGHRTLDALTARLSTELHGRRQRGGGVPRRRSVASALTSPGQSVSRRTT
jgi:hypothetical protein